jgi:iron complex outermembrane recepter protein
MRVFNDEWRFWVLGVGLLLILHPPANAAQIEEIVVVAQKRQQNLQDVSLAVSAYSASDLEQAGVVDITHLSALAPGLQVSTSNSQTDGASFRLRGVGTSGNNPGLEGAVGVFVDGVYLSRPGIAFSDYFDVEQIEILRGPQGTLFGRNTSAGAIVVSTRAPSLQHTEADLGATLGSDGQRLIQVAGGMPVIENQLGFRVSASVNERDSFQRSFLVGDDAGPNRDRWSGRAQMLWTPTDTVDVRLIGDRMKADDEYCCDAVYISDGLGIIPFVASSQSQRSDRITNSGVGFPNPHDQWGVSGELKWRAGPGELTYIGAYREFHSNQVVGDSDFSPADIFRYGPILLDVETTTHEIRYQARSGPVDWLVGAYFSDERIGRSLGSNNGVDLEALIDTSVLAPFGLSYTGIVSALGGSGGITPGNLAISEFGQDGKAWSVFTHLIVDLSPRARATLGLRYVSEEKDGFHRLGPSVGRETTDLVSSAGALTLFTAAMGGDPASAGLGMVLDAFGVPAPAILPVSQGLVGLSCFPTLCGNPLIVPPFERSFDDNAWAGTLRLAYDFSDDIMGYLGYDRGFKAGGILLDSTAAAGLASPAFASETVDAYEIGVRSELFGNRLRANATLFWMDIDDIQVQEFLGAGFTVENVSEAVSRGVEMELAARPLDRLDLALAVAYTDAYFPSGVFGSGDPIGDLVAGKDLTLAPRWSGTLSAGYSWPIAGSSLEAFLYANVAAQSSTRTSTTGGEGDAITRQDSYAKLNARLGLGDAGGRWVLEFWGRNLTDETTMMFTVSSPLHALAGSTGSIAFLDEPRTWGMTFRLRL